MLHFEISSPHLCTPCTCFLFFFFEKKEKKNLFVSVHNRTVWVTFRSSETFNRCLHSEKYSELSEWRSNIWCILAFLHNVETNPQQGGRPSESRLVKKWIPSGRLSPNRKSNRPSFQWPSRQTALPQKACSRRPGWELCWGWNWKADLSWKIKKKVVGLGQGAQIGNFAGHGIESGFNLEKQKNGRFGAVCRDWELCWGIERQI